MFLIEILRRQPRWLVLLEALVMVGLIGWFDYLTGWEWGFFAPYAVPIVLVVWKTDWRWGLATASLCAGTFWVSHIGGNPYHTAWALALAVFGWWFYFSVLVVAVSAVKTHHELDRAKIMALERTGELERAVILATEEEQQRIGRDLHDGLGPHLAAIGYAATFLEDELCQRDPSGSEKAGKIREMVRDAALLTKDLACGLCGIPMDGPGLSVALEKLAHGNDSMSGASVTYSEQGDTSVADQETGMHFYRIAQEALRNAQRHAHAGLITISLRRIGKSLCLTIADNGKGMPEKATGHHGMGLDSMRFRARVLGGKLMIDSNPGEGTVVSCEAPGISP